MKTALLYVDGNGGPEGRAEEEERVGLMSSGISSTVKGGKADYTEADIGRLVNLVVGRKKNHSFLIASNSHSCIVHEIIH